jgi:hypothetical protein
MKKRSSKRSDICLVRFNPGKIVPGSKFPFKIGETLLFFGEIENMPEHCAVAKLKSGKIYVGYHLDNFEKLSESET